MEAPAVPLLTLYIREVETKADLVSIFMIDRLQQAFDPEQSLWEDCMAPAPASCLALTCNPQAPLPGACTHTVARSVPHYVKYG